MARELVERRPVLPSEIIRRGWVSEKTLLKTQLPWIRQGGWPKTLPDAHRFELVDVHDPELEGMVQLVVAQHGHGENACHVLMGVAAQGARPDDPVYPYHPFTSRPFARSMRTLVEQDERFKQLARDAKGGRRTIRRFRIFDIRLPTSSIHGELLKRKLIAPTPTSIPPRPRTKITWKEYQVVRLEVPGIQNNVPVVIGTFLDNKGKTHQAAIGVAKVGTRTRASPECPDHHRFSDKTFAKLMQRRIYSPKKSVS
ncbi:hypothetical protein HYV43_04670 [Candidatus Micrarchaeota archaeon]|nr:hypothetical protein [Candidatus Micrarchaeota archaeon]